MSTLDDAIRQWAKILIVDDDAGVTQLLETTLRLNGFKNVKSTVDSRGVIAHFIEYQPDMVLLDLQMPHVDGFQLLDLMNPLVGEDDCLPVLVISAQHDIEARCRALSNGATDFLQKPFFSQEVVLRIANFLKMRYKFLDVRGRNQDLESEVRKRTQIMEDYELELRQAQLETITRLARAAEHHDNETAQHTQRVGLTCTLLAQSVGLPEKQVNLLQRAAPLHDVGKIGIPDSILLKPGKFTEAEYTVMKRHCRIGGNLLGGGHSDLLHMAEQIAVTHHEKWDGSGYPHRLSGDEIDIHGRILAVADVFDALTHERPYKTAWTVEEAINEIENQRGRHFDPKVVDAFLTLPHETLL